MTIPEQCHGKGRPYIERRNLLPLIRMLAFASSTRFIFAVLGRRPMMAPTPALRILRKGKKESERRDVLWKVETGGRCKVLHILKGNDIFHWWSLSSFDWSHERK